MTHGCVCVALQRTIGKLWDKEEAESYQKIATDASLDGVFLK